MKKAIAAYLDDTFKLASTLVIKSEDSIDRINQLLRLQHGVAAVDTHRPDTWKYYRNICGLYHLLDEPMWVSSVDTMEQIPFTKESLKDHPDTRIAYDYGTRFYYELLSHYPEQESLILGILYPADMDTAIAAEDGAILAYPKRLVESQEVTLIEELQRWIQYYLVRWHVRGFGVSDSLYATAQHAQLYMHLVPKLLNLRLKRCKTLEVHSFHIRQYLASHGRLDRFMDYMTLKQQLFFYRNLAYIERHVGHRDTFHWLIEKLLSDRNLPIAEYTCRFLGSFQEDYSPDYWFRKRPLNTAYNVPEKDYYDLRELMDKEAPMAPRNLAYSHDHYDTINQTFEDSLSSVVQTKDLESSMLDYIDAVPVTLTDVVLNHWAYYSHSGHYRSGVYFIDPRSGQERVIWSHEAFIYLFYLTLRLINIDPVEIPPLLVRRVRRIVKPSKEDLMSVVDPKYFKPFFHGTKDFDLAWSLQPVVKHMPSRASFFALCEQLYECELTQWILYSNDHHMSRSGYLKNAFNRFYSTEWIRYPETGRNYREWLSERNLITDDYRREDLLNLITAVYQAGSGHVIDPTKLLKNIQAAMLAIFDQLSSYSIQFIREINEVPLNILNWGAIRVEELGTKEHGEFFVRANIKVIETFNQAHQYTNFEIKPFLLTWLGSCHQEENLLYRIDLTFQQDYKRVEESYTTFTGWYVQPEYEGYDPHTLAHSGWINGEAYNQLTPEQRRQIPDVYGQRYDNTYQLAEVSLPDLIRVRYYPRLYTSLSGA